MKYEIFQNEYNQYYIYDNDKDKISHLTGTTINKAIDNFYINYMHTELILDENRISELKKYISDTDVLVCYGESFDEIKDNYPELFI
jgi:hypothetical protein